MGKVSKKIVHKKEGKTVEEKGKKNNRYIIAGAAVVAVIYVAIIAFGR